MDGRREVEEEGGMRNEKELEREDRFVWRGMGEEDGKGRI